MKTIRINSHDIHCEADKFGAKEYEVHKPGRLYIVTAHNEKDAKKAADDAWRDGVIERVQDESLF